MRTGAGIHDVARWTAPLAVAAGALLCAWMGLRLVGTLLAGDGDNGPAAAVVTPPLLDAPRESLAKWHLFGSALAPVDARSAAIDAPDTALELTLSGILAESDPSNGIAMIAQGDDTQSAYRVGDVLPGNARLKGVYADHVLIVHNGRDEALRLPRERSAIAVGSGAAAAGSAVAAGAGVDARATPNAPVAVAGLETVDWNAVQQQIQVDPAELARQVRVAPVIENGQIVGMRLGGGANAPLLAKLGLQPDDVVTAVNGISVRDTGRAQQVIAAVRDAKQVSVTVRRNGREETLNVSLQ